MLGIGTDPSFAIGQRALLIQTGEHDTIPMRLRSHNNPLLQTDALVIAQCFAVT